MFDERRKRCAFIQALLDYWPEAHHCSTNQTINFISLCSIPLILLICCAGAFGCPKEIKFLFPFRSIPAQPQPIQFIQYFHSFHWFAPASIHYELFGSFIAFVAFFSSRSLFIAEHWRCSAHNPQLKERRESNSTNSFTAPQQLLSFLNQKQTFLL